MIKLNKLDEPQILQQNKRRWTNEYAQAKNRGNVPDSVKYRYRHPDIKRRLRQETHDKCAYCESKITHTYPGDIEHILPRARFANLIFEWTNLTLGCGECNRRKGTYYSAVEPLVNPYIDDPDNHFYPAGAFVFGKLADRKGGLTELKLELNRAELVERRSERIKSIRNLAERYASSEEGELKDLLRNELRREIDREKEFSFTSKGFLKICFEVTLD